MGLVVVTFSNHVTQTFVVPAGVNSLATHIIGSSGGQGNALLHPGGWGPIFDGDLAVTPGETLTLQVGQFGGGAGTGANAGSGSPGYPDGGSGGVGPAFNRGGGGGGSSRIWRGGIGGTLLLLVAGGGGAAARDRSANPATGNGGVPIGETTTGGPAATGNGGNGNPVGAGGLGGTPSAGGAGGPVGTLPGFPGSSLQGGAGRAGTGINPVSGGGGGGGLFGGGGGSSGFGGSGGGGSSYIDLAEGWTGTTWDTTVPFETTTLLARDGRIRFTYSTGGGWSLGLRSILG